MAAIKLNALDHIFEKYEGKNGNLIPVLHEIQEEVGYLPVEVQRYVSEKLGVAMSKIYGVISFYSFFTTDPRGEHTIGVCMGTACYVKGAEDILNRLKEELNIETGQTTADNKFTMTLTRCLGTCSMAPVIMIDDQVHGNLSAAKVPEIINKY